MCDFYEGDRLKDFELCVMKGIKFQKEYHLIYNFLY